MLKILLFILTYVFTGLYLTGFVRGFDPPQEVADPPPPESSAEPLRGVDSNPHKNPPILFSC